MTAPASENLLYSVDNGIAKITFNRPQARNAMLFSMYERMAEICTAANDDRSIKAIILTGAGDKAFASGTDISQFREFKTAQDALDYEARIDRVLTALETCRVPTIAAIAGACTGGGAGIAACCDLRIGVTTSRMFMPAARFGLHYYQDGLRRYVGRLGDTAARKLLLTGCTIGAEEMLRIGFLSELVAPEQLDATVARHVEQLVACEPGAVAAMKQSLNQLAAVDEAVLRAIEGRYLASLGSPALRARLARRAPASGTGTEPSSCS